MIGWYRFLYSCLEAIAVGERLNQLLLQVNLTLYSLSVNFQYIFSSNYLNIRVNIQKK